MFESTSRALGRRTRPNSASARRMSSSRSRSRVELLTTRSKLASANGSASASPPAQFDALARVPRESLACLRKHLFGKIDAYRATAGVAAGELHSCLPVPMATSSTASPSRTSASSSTVVAPCSPRAPPIPHSPGRHASKPQIPVAVAAHLEHLRARVLQLILPRWRAHRDPTLLPSSDRHPPAPSRNSPVTRCGISSSAG
jgi:hypothetical protein